MTYEISLERLKLESSDSVYLHLQAMSNVSLRVVDHPSKGRSTGHVIHFRIALSLKINFSGMAEDTSERDQVHVTS